MGLRTLLVLRLAAAAGAVTVSGSSAFRRHTESRVAPYVHVQREEGTVSVLDRVLEGVDQIIEGVAEALDTPHTKKAHHRKPATVQLQDMQYTSAEPRRETDAEAHESAARAEGGGKAHRKPATVQLQDMEYLSAEPSRDTTEDAEAHPPAKLRHRATKHSRPAPTTRSEIMQAADEEEAQAMGGGEKAGLNMLSMYQEYWRSIAEQVFALVGDWLGHLDGGRRVSLAEFVETGSTSFLQELAAKLIRAAGNVKQRLIEARNEMASSSATLSSATMDEDDGTEVITQQEMKERMHKGLVDEVVDKFVDIAENEYSKDGLRTMLADVGPDDLAKQVASRMKSYAEKSRGHGR